MATLELQDGSAGLAAVTFVAALSGSCDTYDEIESGVHAGSWTKEILLLVRNTNTDLDCCCDPVETTVTVYAHVTGHDECDCCSPIAGDEYEVPSHGGVAVIPIHYKHFGQLVRIEYGMGSEDLEVAAVTTLKGYVIPSGEE